MHLDIKHFNQLDRVLEIVLAAGGENATVAGGAVRDSVLEKPIADIDVFYEGDLDPEVIGKAFGRPEDNKHVNKDIPPKPFVDWGNPGSPLYEGQIDALEMWETEYGHLEQYDKTFSVDNYKGDLVAFEGMKVQLIKVGNVDEHIATFPCFLSRMLYSEGHLVIPKEALQDISLGIVRFTDNCSEKYKAKIEEKYNDYL